MLDDGRDDEMLDDVGRATIQAKFPFAGQLMAREVNIVQFVPNLLWALESVTESLVLQRVTARG